MKVGFALVAENRFVRDIVEAEKTLSGRFDFLTSLGTQYNLPHTTIFQGEFPEDFPYARILGDLAEKTGKTGLETLDFTGVRYVPEGWYFYFCRKTAELAGLHNYALELIRDFVVLRPERLRANLSILSPEELAGLKNYGYIYSGAAFSPHITLARTAAGENPEIVKAFESRLDRFTRTPRIGRLTAYAMGENGCHEKTLAEIRLA